MQESGSEGSKWAYGVEAGALFASRLPAWAAVGITIAGLAASWAIVYQLGGSGRVAPHFFYFPILFAAARSGHAGAIATAVASGLLAGPLMPLDVDAGTSQRFSDWGSRAAFFVVIGLHMSLVAARLKTVAARKLRLAKERTDLATHKAAVIQNVTHEFRTPLTIIGGMAQTLERPGFATDLGKPLVVRIRSATEKLTMLVEGVITTALALEEDRRVLAQVKIDLARMCRELMEGLEQLGGPSRVRVNLGPDADAIRTCREFLEVALRSIIENALKFSPEDAPVEISSRRTNGNMELRVRDHGIGIPENFLRDAFDPFTQMDESTTRDRGGLGLGLFAAKVVTERMGGSISVEQVQEGGTEVVIVIPQMREEDALLRRGDG